MFTVPEPADPSYEVPEVRFAYEMPESACPSRSALASLPAVDGHSYELVEGRFRENEINIYSSCRYRLEGTDGRGEDPVLADHVRVYSQASLYRSPLSASFMATYYTPIPVGSGVLDDWRYTGSHYESVWWKGCEGGDPCEDGERPIEQTTAWESKFTGHVGNLGYIVLVQYIAEEEPADVEVRNARIFRELVLADIVRRERVE